jgi:hypothetical protein
MKFSHVKGCNREQKTHKIGCTQVCSGCKQADGDTAPATCGGTMKWSAMVLHYQTHIEY